MKKQTNNQAEERRSFIKKLSLLGLSGAAVSLLAEGAEASEAVGASNEVIAGPYLQNVKSNEATIVWVTRGNAYSWVEYGTGKYFHLKQFAYNNGLKVANNRINKITLTDLKPNSTYLYRIVSQEILNISGSRFDLGESNISAGFSFTTPAPDEKEFKMVVLNDIHERRHTIPQLLYKYGYDGNTRDFDLVVYNGDMFDNVNNEEQLLDKFILPSVEVFASEVPFLFVQGNHEVRGAFARQISEYFEFEDKRFYHAFTRANARIIVVDAGEDKADDNWEYAGLVAFDQYREKQAEWLKEELQSPECKKARFRIVLIHISPWHSGDWHGTLHCRKLFGPLLNDGNIDLQISGHTHSHGYYPADNDHNFPIIIGGGPQEGRRTVIKVAISPNQLKAKMLTDSGEVVAEL